MRNHLGKATVCTTLALILSLAFPLSALADVKSSDEIGGKTISELNISVSEAPDADAQCAILEAADGTVLWGRNVDTSMAMASTTKIMTAVVALESGIDLDSTVYISEEATEVGDSSAGLTAGTATTLRALLYGMLIISGNDAATQIAITVGGSVSNFVDMMNDKAAELGMTSSHFENPHGLDADGHYTSPSDLALLARYAMKKDVFREIVGSSTATVDLGYGETTLTNTDQLLTIVDGCIGIKTGTEDNAGYCLVSCVNRNNLELYSVILGCSEDYLRFTSASSLMEWGYAHYVSVALCDTSTVVADVPHSEWTDVTVPVVCETEQSAYVLDFNGAICSNVSYVTVKGDIKKGDPLGTITWTQGDKVIATSRLVAAGDVAAPSFFDAIGVWFKRTFTDSADTADCSVLVDTIDIQDPSSVSVS